MRRLNMYRVLGRSRGTDDRGGMGFGFRGSSPPWPYVGRGRGGLPRCAYFTGSTAVNSPMPGIAPMKREEELKYLKRQAQAAKDNLDRINSRLQELESKN
jgi:Family of unknown function (DUF5320)